MQKISKYIQAIIKTYCDLDGNGKIEKSAKYDEISIFNQACESFNEQTGDFFVCNKKYNINNKNLSATQDATVVANQQILPISKLSEDEKIKKHRAQLGLPNYESKEYIAPKMYKKWSKIYKDSNLNLKFYEKLYDTIDKLHCTIKDEDFKKDKYHSKKEQTMEEVIAVFARESQLNSHKIGNSYHGIFQLDDLSLKTIQNLADKYNIKGINKNFSIKDYVKLSGEQQLDYLVGHIAYALKTGNFSEEKSMTPSELWAMVKMPNGWKNPGIIKEKNDTIQSMLKKFE